MEIEFAGMIQPDFTEHSTTKPFAVTLRAHTLITYVLHVAETAVYCQVQRKHGKALLKKYLYRKEIISFDWKEKIRLSGFARRRRIMMAVILFVRRNISRASTIASIEDIFNSGAVTEAKSFVVLRVHGIS